jgi:hypothetical protein
MTRPKVARQHEGLTRSEVAKQLRYSVSNIRRLQVNGILPRRKDPDGNYRFKPHEVAAAARLLGRTPEGPEAEVDGPTAAKVYDCFRAPWFRGDPGDFARVVSEVRIKPRVVLDLYAQYRRGAGTTEEEEEESREMERTMRYFDKQIAAGEAALAKKRGAMFISADGQDNTPPSSR